MIQPKNYPLLNRGLEIPINNFGPDLTSKIMCLSLQILWGPSWGQTREKWFEDTQQLN